MVMSFTWPVDLETTGLDEDELDGKRYYPKLVPGLMEQFVLIRQGEEEVVRIPDRQAIAVFVANHVIDQEIEEQEETNV